MTGIDNVSAYSMMSLICEGVFVMLPLCGNACDDDDGTRILWYITDYLIQSLRADYDTFRTAAALTVQSLQAVMTIRTDDEEAWLFVCVVGI